MDKEGTQTNGSKDKLIDDYAQGLSRERWQILLGKKKKEKENSPALKIK